MSYDLESLFTNIPFNETIEYLLDQTYNKKRLEPLCSKLIFKRLLTKLATEVTFTINKNFYKQTETKVSQCMAFDSRLKTEKNWVDKQNGLKKRKIRCSD